MPALAPVFGLGVEPGGDFSDRREPSHRVASRLRRDAGDVGSRWLSASADACPGHCSLRALSAGHGGFAAFRADHVLVALAYERWSDYPGPLGSTLECPSDVPACGTSAPPPPNASDVFVPRLAGSHEFSIATHERGRACGLCLRAGRAPRATRRCERIRFRSPWGFARLLARASARRRAASPRRGVPARSPGSPHPRKGGWLGDSDDAAMSRRSSSARGSSYDRAAKPSPGRLCAGGARGAGWVFFIFCEASPGARAGFGSRSQALAGADVGDAGSGAAVFVNPAALVQTPDTELSLGTSIHQLRLYVRRNARGAPSVPTFDFAAVIPGSVLRFPSRSVSRCRCPTGASRSFTMPSRRSRTTRSTTPAPACSISAWRSRSGRAWLAIGGGVGFLAAAQGGFRVAGTAVAADGSGSEYASDLRHSVDADLISVRYPIFGATSRRPSELVFGLLFRGSATIEQRVSASLWARPCSGPRRFPCATVSKRRRASRSCRACSRSAGARSRSRLAPERPARLGGVVVVPESVRSTEHDARGRAAARRHPPPGRTAAAARPGSPRQSLRSACRSGATVRCRPTTRARCARVDTRTRPRSFPTVRSKRCSLISTVTSWRSEQALLRVPFAPFAEIRLDFHASLVQCVTRGLTRGPPIDRLRSASAGDNSAPGDPRTRIRRPRCSRPKTRTSAGPENLFRSGGGDAPLRSQCRFDSRWRRLSDTLSNARRSDLPAKLAE